MKQKQIWVLLGFLTFVIVGSVLAAGPRSFDGDIGVNTWINTDVNNPCPFFLDNSYTVQYNITNFNITNATATNVTYYANITDNGNLVYEDTETRHFTVGEQYVFYVDKCASGMLTHTIVSSIVVQDPIDQYPANNQDSDTVSI